jgi:hypothetical protein
VESIGKVTARLMRQLTLQRHCPGVTVIVRESDSEAHCESPAVELAREAAGGTIDACQQVMRPASFGGMGDEPQPRQSEHGTQRDPFKRTLGR